MFSREEFHDVLTELSSESSDFDAEIRDSDDEYDPEAEDDIECTYSIILSINGNI